MALRDDDDDDFFLVVSVHSVFSAAQYSTKGGWEPLAALRQLHPDFGGLGFKSMATTLNKSTSSFDHLDDGGGVDGVGDGDGDGNVDDVAMVVAPLRKSHHLRSSESLTFARHMV
eukprot:CAMPEP_0170172256 /NCGR_PEP_ID=MMETSP0040_2-20121228/5493_1 /TAXON_ID=641309 /ORGANISM="Lotharella oceanica, Strain CCMP622" /LENGTH=114 /DNA_ID=CAMNT_0010412821 /DNA_START=109 /DNA_END=454 /DNA_ORIENTATION=+